MGDRIARVTVFGGMLLFGMRGIMAEQTLLTASLLCLGIASVAEFFYTSCILRKECLIGEMARRQGFLKEEHVRHVLIAQEQKGGRFGEIARMYDYLTVQQVEMLLAEQESA